MLPYIFCLSSWVESIFEVTFAHIPDTCSAHRLFHFQTFDAVIKLTMRNEFWLLIAQIVSLMTFVDHMGPSKSTHVYFFCS